MRFFSIPRRPRPRTWQGSRDEEITSKRDYFEKTWLLSWGGLDYEGTSKM